MLSNWYSSLIVLVLTSSILKICIGTTMRKMVINRNEFETLEKLLEEEMNSLYYTKDWSSTKQDLLRPEQFDIEHFNNSIVELFSTPRNHEDPTQKLIFQQKLKDRLASYGYSNPNVIEQSFRVRYTTEVKQKSGHSENVQNLESGKNIIATLNGRYSDESKLVQRDLLRKIINLRRNKIDKKIFNETITDHDLAVIEESFMSKQKDKLVVIGAHYDTFSKDVIGIEDNGAASFVILELARLLKDFRFKLNYTILFVWLDFEELGALGSMAFVDHFLKSNYLKNHTFHGAIILDMLLHSDKQPKIDEMKTKFTSWNESDILPELNDVYQDVGSSDSLSMWYRKQSDASFAHQLITTFSAKQSSTPTITLVPVKLDIEDSIFKKRPLDESATSFKSQYRFYLRGDHSSFWSQSTRSQSAHNLPTVLMTNMAPWRDTAAADCYHKSCDDLRALTEHNLVFLNKLIYLLRDAIIDLDN